jgi:two-component system sensor histidine kinase HydH
VDTNLATAFGQEATPLAAAEKRHLLERLLARVAHEIRNPLSSLDIHVQLLEEDLGALAPGLRDRMTPRLDIIQGELHRLKSIVETYLRLTSPSALEVEPIDIIGIVNHVCELLRPEAAARGIAILTRLPPAPPVMAGDPVRLSQALLNLVINALQALPPHGRVEVAVNTSSEDLSVVVRDNGPGIPVDKLPFVFDPYFTTKAEGHGLGLWIAQQIVAAHAGTLTAQNAPDGGAVFAMVLPRKARPGQTSAAP